MDWITFAERSPFVILEAVQAEGRLSSEFASAAEVDEAVRQLKHQLDVAANRAKLALQKPPKDPFNA